MSLIRRGEHRQGRVATAATTVALLGAFQVLAIIGAGTAGAVPTCEYDSSLDRIDITIDSGNSVNLAVETTSDNLDAAAAAGSILFSTDFGATFLACGSASITNTVTVVVLGVPSTDEFFVIDEYSSGGQFPATIAWHVDLGTNTVAGDWFEWWGNDGSNPGTAIPRDDTVVVTGAGFELNDAIGELNGSAENIYLYGGDGDDVLDGSGLTSSYYFEAYGEDGDDWIAPGAYGSLPTLGDYVEGGTTGEVDGDTLSYATRTTTVVIDNALGQAGHSANADCDLVDPGDEQDTHLDFENFESGSADDCLVGAAGAFEWWIPDGGNDTVTGQSADGDTIDFSAATAAVTITMNTNCSGSATGDGEDKWTDIDAFYGSDFDDVLLYEDDCPATYFAGGDGVDTVDASAETTAVDIDLDALDGSGATDTTENAIGGSSSDELDGNDLRNRLEGGAGNDFLDGWGGNDTMLGGPGNDDFTGGTGADTVDFGASEAGIDADVSLGFASGEGDDSFSDFVEIVKGSAFNDQITGGKTGLGSSINNRITGRAGNDILTGSDSNDYLKGGAGNDKLRGLEGGDTLAGGKGKDKGWGGPGTDVCKKVEKQKSCEI